MLAKREGMGWLAESLWGQSFAFLGSPMIALAISVLLAVYTLMPHANKHDTLERLEEGLQTAGIILLVTGAGGALGRCCESGAGTQLAQQVAGLPISPVLIPFVIATLVRVIQGSGTVAMITAASISAPIVSLLPGVNMLAAAQAATRRAVLQLLQRQHVLGGQPYDGHQGRAPTDDVVGAHHYRGLLACAAWCCWTGCCNASQRQRGAIC